MTPLTILIDARQRAGLSQRALGDALGIPYQMIQKWERGRYAPSPPHIEALAEALGLSEDDLYAATGQIPADIADALASRGNTLYFRRVRCALGIETGAQHELHRA